MRISFICGSLALGKDGVGDYTRRLAAELCQSGHECQLISLNDSENSTSQTEYGATIVRFKNALHGLASHKVEAVVAEWNPEWVSLQFVCFAFHPKGFILRLSSLIGNLRIGRKLEIMFHELWVGEQPSLPFKHKVMGRIQQWLILSALVKWKPDCIHTSNRLYQHILQRHGYASQRLPIFGNIPIAPVATASKITRADDQRILLFPFSQRLDWNVETTLAQLKKLALASKVSLSLVQIGNLRSGLQHWNKIETFAREQGWECQRLAAQSEETVSQWMLAADIGISSAHIHLADKSGAVVAMHEHGLPVICTITDPVSKTFKESPKPEEGLYSFFDQQETLINLFKHPPKRRPQARLPRVAHQWLEDLRESSLIR
ncbi:hypothetical protein ACWPKO_00520 [Coraliomargarita sp. W4R53]